MCRWCSGKHVADQLRDLASTGSWGAAQHMIASAASEIDRLLTVYADAIKTVARLRAAGDVLAAVMRSGSDSGWDDAIDAWDADDNDSVAVFDHITRLRAAGDTLVNVMKMSETSCVDDRDWDDAVARWNAVRR